MFVILLNDPGCFTKDAIFIFIFVLTIVLQVLISFLDLSDFCLSSQII